jgi:hypothetical protein
MAVEFRHAGRIAAMLSNSRPILQIAASPALIERGCVQVIGLEEIRAEIGERWEKRKETVWAHLESLLGQKLGPTDFYVQLDDTSFLVSMPTAQEDEAQTFCLRVAHDLHDSLLGRCDTGKLRIARVSSVQDGDVQTTAVTGQALHILAGRAGLKLPQSGASMPQPAKIGPKPTRLDKFQHSFLPVWDAQKEAITTYRAISGCDQPAIEGLNRGAKFELALTLSRINDAGRRLAAHLAAGERFMMWLPLSYDVLSSPVGRMEVAGACRTLSSDLRPYFIFEICDLPQGVPQSRLSELVGSLRPFCRIVAAQLPIRTANDSAYLGAGLQAIGVSVAGCAAAEMGKEIMRLSQAAKKKQQLMTFVLDVPSGEVLQAARALGIHLLSSPLIGGLVSDPAPIRRLSARSISEATAPSGVAA